MIVHNSVPKEIIGKTLCDIGKYNDRLIVLSSDVSVSCNVDIFSQYYPERYLEMGIAEQSTMSVCGGLASEGFIPIYVALAIFSCCMTYPQMRQICNANLNVKIVGTHSGVDDGQDGVGHHATEDLALTRVLPNMTVLTPSDENEVEAAIQTMVNTIGPVYMRVAREPQPIIHKKNCKFEIGKAEIIFDEGNDFAIIYEGSSLKQALEGFELLKKHNKKGKLVSIRSIKPLDIDLIKELSYNVKTIITIENHSVIGGLYGAISEMLVNENVNIYPIGFNDMFTESGTPEDIKYKYGVSGRAILKAYMNNVL